MKKKQRCRSRLIKARAGAAWKKLGARAEWKKRGAGADWKKNEVPEPEPKKHLLAPQSWFIEMLGIQKKVQVDGFFTLETKIPLKRKADIQIHESKYAVDIPNIWKHSYNSLLGHYDRLTDQPTSQPRVRRGMGRLVGNDAMLLTNGWQQTLYPRKDTFNAICCTNHHTQALPDVHSFLNHIKKIVYGCLNILVCMLSRSLKTSLIPKNKGINWWGPWAMVKTITKAPNSILKDKDW